MGTNYYLHDKPDCECCGRKYEPVHIGKSSGGWCFSLHVIPDDNINTLDDWLALWTKSGCYIRDEYGVRITPDEMAKIITEREWRSSAEKDDLWFSKNSAERGPNGLARQMVDGRHCIGNGDGTWDYITGEFS